MVTVPPGAAGGPAPGTAQSGRDSRAAAEPGIGRDRRPLVGPWTFRRVAAGAGAAEEPWRPASVPGTVHTDLLANGLIGDPFFRLSEAEQQWIERESWEYRTVVAVEPATLDREQVELVFAGLDTFAEVFVNGAAVLWATNMFRTWRVSVKEQLVAGDNVVVVRFRSPIAQVKPAADGLGYRLPAANDQAAEMVSMWARKAPYHYGWDWGPRFVTSGIWRPVALEVWDGARLDDVQAFQQRLDDTAAELSVTARVIASRAGRARLEVTARGPTASRAAAVTDAGAVAASGAVTASPAAATLEADLQPGANDVTVPLRIDRPQRWWPNGLGPQHLYAIDVRLVDATTGAAQDERRTRVGLRTVEVVSVRDQIGKSFTVVVNGGPVFMKGANWIPADSFLPRVTPARYRQLLGAAAAANMNMLRVWGGGVYEDDAFYDLCDELGLLVWQDFMFACSMYPGNAAFVENVRREAIENVRRLRNHPSLALWAGNNEIEIAWQGWGWPARFALSKAAQETIWRDYRRLFHEVLPAIVATEDPGRFYTPSSPSANEEGVPANTRGWGDMHFWDVWHGGKPYEAYADNVSRFMSEYGFQSFPELASVARYTAAATDWDVESPVMLAHQRHPRGNALIRTYLDRDFRPPRDFASFLYLGQVLQARVMKYAAESHRRAMGSNWGSLYWQLDDCWPVASWSGIDYYGRWKALHHHARRFFAPVLVSVVEQEGAVNVWLVSDRRADVAARLSLRLIDLDGRELWRRDEDVTVSANASRRHASIRRRQALAGARPERVVLIAELNERGVRGARLPGSDRAIFTFVKPKALDLTKPDLRFDVEPRGDGVFSVRVSADVYAPSVFLTLVDDPGGGDDTTGRSATGAAASGGFFEDNHFDVLPGETVTVGFHPAPDESQPTASALRARLRALTVADTH